jgi:cyclophilin family peptidyl-prolyl cis-trans isomerase/cell division protein FtsL
MIMLNTDFQSFRLLPSNGLASLFPVKSAVLAVALLMASNGGLHAQNSVKQLKQQWAKCDQELNQLEQEISETAKPTEELSQQYKDTVAEAKRLVEQIETAAKKELEADRTSVEATRSLLGIMLDAASKDQDRKVLQLGDFLIKKGINPKYFEIAAKSERLSISQKEIFDELLIRHAETMADDLPRAKLETTKGDIVIELFENQAPGTVGNFVSLAEQGYFDGVLFHRVIEGFMAQTGGIRVQDGKETGQEGPGYNIQDEYQTPEARLHFTDSVSMANRGIPNTGGSQFFMTFDRTDFLDKKHTVFGRVIEGFEVLENIERTNTTNQFGQEQPIEGVRKDILTKVTILRKRDHEYTPVKVEQQPEEEAEGPDLNAPGDGEN